MGSIRPQGLRTAATLALAMCVGGCREGATDGGAAGEDGTGASDGADDGAGDGEGSDGGGDDGVPACDDAEMGPAPLRRLTHREFENTIHDLLGLDGAYAAGFPTEASETSFDNQAATLGVGPLLAEGYLHATEAIAADAIADLDGLLTCYPAAVGEDACAAEWIEEFGLRAYRRPLSAAQQQRLQSLYDTAKAEHGFETAIELVLQAMLQSPYFLYRVEATIPDDAQTDVVALDDWEIASRLSYLLWGSMPDAALFDAAAAGTLADRDGIEAQAWRMLEDPRARTMVADFHRQWLRLDDVDTMDKDAAMFPELTDALRASMKEGTQAFVEHVIFEGQGDLATLLSSEVVFADDTLAPILGIDPPGSSTPVQAVAPEGHRAGILTQPSVMAATAKATQSSPIGRGVFVQARVMCTTLPEPPAGVDTTLPEIDEDATTRERFAQHTADPACAGCHELIDPLGFGFEHYDPLGRYRISDNGRPVDASGTVVVDGEPVDFDGAVELAATLTQQSQVHDCFVQQWFTYAHGRAPQPEDACSVGALQDSFESEGQDVQALLVALTTTDAFRFRPADGGGQ